MKKTAPNGFTLVELLIVISILAILAVLGIVVFSNITASARDSKRKADIQAIAKTMEVNYNSGSGYQIDGSNFASQLLPIPPRSNDYQIYYADNNQSFLTCTKLEKTTTQDGNYCSLNSDPNKCFCLRSTQGTDVYPDPDDGKTEVTLIQSSGILSTPASVDVSEVIPAANGSPSPIASAQVTETTTEITTGLAGYWKLDEASGNRIDATGRGNDLTDNTVTQSDGKINKAAQFRAANSGYLSLADNASISTGDIDYTFAGWLYMDSKPGRNMRIIAKYPGGANSNIEYDFVYVGSAKRFYFFLGHANNNYTSVIADNFEPALNTWVFFVFWHDSVNNEIGIQINNDPANTTATTQPAQDLSSAFAMGAATGGLADSFFDGRIDEIGFWKRVLTASEKTALYNSGDGGQPSL